MEMPPMNMGPAVKGWGPQYSGSCLEICFRLGCPARFSSLTVSLSGPSAPAEDPPLKLGIIRFGSSSQP